MTYRHGGFTIVELMITIVLIAILTTIAAPSLRDLVMNGRMTSLANDFMTDLSVARSEAVKRGVRTATTRSPTMAYGSCSGESTTVAFQRTVDIRSSRRGVVHATMFARIGTRKHDKRA